MTSSTQVNLNALGSKWDGLSPHLIARFYAVKELRDSNTGRVRWVKEPGVKTVAAPLTDTASLEITLNWQSPFEHAGLESKAPTMMAMLQSGALQPLIDEVKSVGDSFASFVGAGGKEDEEAKQRSDGFLSKFVGRAGITKLNSTQVFNGMPPLKFTVTALFRAWEDAQSEVEAPFDQLMQWALPVKLAEDGTMMQSALNTIQGKNTYIEALMPSAAPTKIFMDYKGRTYGPLVIESVGVPINSAITADAKYAEMAVPLTICSLTAIDRKDWTATMKGGGIR
jgi:hypothetical protein